MQDKILLTPFLDNRETEELLESSETKRNVIASDFSLNEFFSPFQRTYEASSNFQFSPIVEIYSSMRSELEDSEFNELTHDLLNEMEDSWVSMNNNGIISSRDLEAYKLKKGREYYKPILNEANRIIDQVSEYYSGKNLSDPSEHEMEFFFENLEMDNESLSPVQEQFLGGLIKKVKKVVKKGVEVAKKGMDFAKKFSPIHILLNKLKLLVKPLLEKVLGLAINKFPANLQPHIKTLASKLLRLESREIVTQESEVDSINHEFNHTVAELFVQSDELESDSLISEYEESFEHLLRDESYNQDFHNQISFEDSKDKFINELGQLRAGEDPTPVIERFIPAAIMTLKPVIKMAISMIGRDKIISFLANLLSGLVKKFVPAEVSKPLANRIIDIGLAAIGFEVHETDSNKVAYEAIANSISEAVEGLNELDSEAIQSPELLSLHLLESFEKAAANNFPPNYIKPELRNSSHDAIWIYKPRKSSSKLYKKYTKVFDIKLDSRIAEQVKSFRGLTLKKFLSDKFGLDLKTPLLAKMHIYELGHCARLSHISKYENLPNLNPRIKRSFVCLQPLTEENASLLINESKLGSKFDNSTLASRYNVKPRQRFFFLDFPGATFIVPQVKNDKVKVKISQPSHIEARSEDAQLVLDFIKSEIYLNYFLSEEVARKIVESMNKNDIIGIADQVRKSVKGILENILRTFPKDKIKIINESAIDQLFVEEDLLNDERQSGIIKSLENGLIERVIIKLNEFITSSVYKKILSKIKLLSLEFIKAQADAKDGVTLSFQWKSVNGMSTVKNLIDGFKNGTPIPSLNDFKLPTLSEPELVITGGKQFK